MTVPLHASVRAWNPNCGLPDAYALKRRGVVERYAKISTFLTEKGISPEKCSPVQLATIIADFRHFLARNFGRDAKTPNHDDDGNQIVIWPAPFFTDFSITGSLACILTAAFSFAKEFLIDSFQFDNPEQESTNTDLVVHVDKALKQAHHLRPIRIFFASYFSEEELDILISISQAHGGAIVSNPDVATHIVYPEVNSRPEKMFDGQVLVRLLERNSFEGEEECLVHWFRHPDSYNDWVPHREVVGHTYDPKPRSPNQPWHLQAKWIRDLRIFNEWMNELDYQMPLSFSTFVGYPPIDDYVAIPAATPTPITRIRFRFSMKKEIAQPIAQNDPVVAVGLPSILEGNSSSVLRPDCSETHQAPSSPPLSSPPLSSPPSLSPYQDSGSDVNASYHGRHSAGHEVVGSSLHDENGHANRVNNGTANDDEHDDDDDDDDDEHDDHGGGVAGSAFSDDDDDEPVLSRVLNKEGAVNIRHVEKINLGNGVSLPYFAKWFDIQEVHDIEKKALPEFFSGCYPSKTLPIYKEMRSFMVRAWRRAPKKYLSATAARRRLAGDTCAVLRVHAFLEHWGLINYSCPLDALPPPSFSRPPRPLPTTAGIDDDVSMRRGVHLILDNGTPARIEHNKVVKNCLDGEIENGDATLDNKSSESLILPIGLTHRATREPVEYHCDSCGIDCSELRFHCATKADLDLCASCYHDGRYSSNLKHRDFIQMTSATLSGSCDDVDSDVWTESETLLLLEALEMYTDNWQMVSEHVGTKGIMQCVFQFLRLPIEDEYLGNTTKKWWSEHPANDAMLATPVEILRSAGVRKAALAAIEMNGYASKSFSGRHAVYGDKMNTIVPFVSMLSSLVAPDMVTEIMGRVDVGSAKIGEAFKCAMAFDKKNDSNMCDDEEQRTMNAVLTDKMYNNLKRQVKNPPQVLDTEMGSSLVRASVELLSQGSIDHDVAKNLKLRDSICDVFKRMRTPIASEDKVGNEGGKTEHSAQSVSTGKRAATEKNVKESDDKQCEKVERMYSSAVGMAALSAAGVSAGQWRCIEEVEIERLMQLILEVKRAMIRRKLELFSKVIALENNVKTLVKRKREEEIFETVMRKRRVTNCKGIYDNNLYVVTCRATKGASVAPMDIYASPNVIAVAKSGNSSVTSTTLEGGYRSLLSARKLPNFCDEVALDNVVLEAEKASVANGAEDSGSDDAVAMHRFEDMPTSMATTDTAAVLRRL